MSYDKHQIRIFEVNFKEDDPKTWPYFPIVMPLKDGCGPVSDSECDEITWEVWDRFCNCFGKYKSLPDAVGRAIILNKELFGSIK